MRTTYIYILLIFFAIFLIGCKDDPINLPVKASFTYSPKDSILTTDSFKLTSTSTPKERIIEYSWDIDGDGKADSKEANPVFFFKQAGRYTIILTVKGNKGDIDLKSTSINVRRPANGTLILYRKDKLKQGVIVAIDTAKKADSLFFPIAPICGKTTKALTLTLKEGTYNLSAIYGDNIATWSKTVDIIGGECNLQEYKFVINTRLEIMVNDTSQKPTPNSSVQLFTSVKDWKAKTNPVGMAQMTGADGKVTFSNLNTVKYWVRANRGILNADSMSVSPILSEGIINSLDVQMKK
jgi:PKD repeat protein